MNLRPWLILFAFIFSYINTNGQVIDSLITVSKNQTDTVLAKTYYELSIEYRRINPDSSAYFANQSLKLSQDADWHKGAYRAYSRHYVLSSDVFNDSLSDLYLDSMLVFAYKMEDASQVGNCYSKKALIRSNKEDYNGQLSLFHKAEKAYLYAGDQQGLAAIYHNNSTLFVTIGEDQTALDYLDRAYAINDSMENYLWGSFNLGSKAIYYYNRGNYDSSLVYHYKSLQAVLKTDSQWGIANGYYNYGNSLNESGFKDSSQKMWNKAMEICEENDMIALQVYIYNSFSTRAQEEGNYPLALKYRNLAMEGALYTNDLGAQRNAHKGFYKIYEATGQYKKAFEHLKAIYDSESDNESKVGSLAQMRYELMYEQIALQDSLTMANELNEEKLRKQEAESAANRNSVIIIAVLILLIISLIAGFYSYRAFKQKQKLAEAIEEQKQQVEQSNLMLESKNKEITDSIRYAKRIQTAILPPLQLVENALPDSFIIYEPKDIVAGDFYWLEQKEDRVLFAAADCTGHGVPGAMVSVVCHNGLNRSVREHNLLDPGKILDKTREIIVQEFEKSEDKVNDGMDIALCSLKGKELYYAGAHNPLWIIRNGSEEIEEIKADKQPIGKFERSLPFNSHRIELEKGDTVYIFSDGFTDQFGGDKGKKFKAKNFKKLLLSVSQESLANQKEKIQAAFDEWKGQLEQLDDVCVIGVRV